MVHIEKVEIYGFKSFGFRNTTVKLAPGLVSISGANGSGKSAILDAIAFALGERSPKILRVGKLSEIIHDQKGGSSKIARASVHLDNAERAIPVDADHINITRILEASGESVYYLNGQKSTRSRIYDVLNVANAGLTGLNHIQQGAISRIADLGANEKREIISESIGLSYFDEKKEQAVRELDKADRHLEIVLAKTGEMRQRIDELEEERTQMIRHSVIQKDLKHYETLLQLQKLVRIKDNIESLGQKVAETDKELQEASGNLDETRTQIDTLEDKKRGLMGDAEVQGDATARIASSIATVRAKHQNAESELRIAERRLTQSRDRADNIRSETQGIIRARKRNRTKQAEAHQKMIQISSKRDSISRSLAEVDRRRSALLDKQARLAAQAAASNQRMSTLTETLAKLDRERTQISLSIRQAKTNADSDRNKIQGLDDSIEDLVSLENRMKLWLKHQDDTIDNMKSLIDKIKSERAGAVSDLNQMAPLIEEAGSGAARYESKLHLVKKVMHEDYSIGRLRTNASQLGVLGTVYELMKWPQSYERAVLACGSDWLKALVVADVQTSAAIEHELRRLRLPRIRIISLDMIHPSVMSDDSPKRLSEFVTCDERLGPLRDLLFGHVTIHRTIRSAEDAAAKGMAAVTVSGRYMRPKGGTILDRGSRISNLTKIISMSSEIGGLQRSVDMLKSMRAGRLKLLRNLDNSISAMSGRCATSREHRASATTSLTDITTRIGAARRSRARILSRLAAYDANLPEKMSRLTHLSEKIEDTKRRLREERASAPTQKAGDMAEQLASVNRHKADFESLQTQATRQYSQADAAWRGTKSAAADLLRRAGFLARENKKMIKEGIEVRNSLPGLRHTVDKHHLALQNLRQEEQKVIQVSSGAMSRLQSCESQLKQLRKQERTLSGREGVLQRRHDSLERDLSHAQTQAARISDTLPPHMAKSMPPDIEVEPLISALKEELDSLPPLNANAPSAYDTLSEGYRAMSDRKNMLEGERNRIVSFIEEIERDKRQRFLEAFDIVDTEIRTIFQKMIGGDASLELEDEDDLFKSGITYMVQFPGKSRRTSTSISGGEKTLAAIAFVLALQKLKPSPFYLFDEIDAALDAPNAENLANILAERAKGFQFVVISHKEFVVQKAGLIYGVYPKNGISQVVTYRDRRVRPPTAG